MRLPLLIYSKVPCIGVRALMTVNKPKAKKSPNKRGFTRSFALVTQSSCIGISVAELR